MKVLVGCPVYDGKSYCWNRWSSLLDSLTYKNKDIFLVDNSKKDDFFETVRKRFNCIKIDSSADVKENIVRSRNIIRERAIDKGYDYFLSLEQDVFPPEDIIEKLLKHKKDIVTAIYPHLMRSLEGKKAKMPLVYIKRKDDEVGPMYPHEIMNKFRKVDACGLGCILIKTDVLKEVKFRYEKGKNAYDDMFFCQDAIKKGYDIWTDGNILCGHWIAKK